MLRPLLCLVFLLSSCHSTAMISPRMGTNPVGICTMDFNPWGQASQCSCDQGQKYDERAGLCLSDGDAENIITQGKLETGMMAVGGETTGIVLTTYDDQSYELIVKVEERERLEKISGQSFEVTGELIKIESVEREERAAIIVEALNVLE